MRSASSIPMPRSTPSLSEIPESARGVPSSVKYNHNEELFLEIGPKITMPRFPIHHDVRQDVPEAPYAYALRDLVRQLADLLPDVFRGLTYYFDPVRTP